jgi:hypothetical protein
VLRKCCIKSEAKATIIANVIAILLSSLLATAMKGFCTLRTVLTRVRIRCSRWYVDGEYNYIKARCSDGWLAIYSKITEERCSSSCATMTRLIEAVSSLLSLVSKVLSWLCTVMAIARRILFRTVSKILS